MQVQLVGRNNEVGIIDFRGLLHADAITRSKVSAASWDGDAFRILAEVDLQSALIEPLFWLQNDRSSRRNGKRQFMVVDSYTIASTANIHMEAWVASTYTSGGVAVTPTPLHRGLTTEAEVTAWDNSNAAVTPLVCSTVGAQEIESMFIGAYRPHNDDFSTALIIPQGENIAFFAQGLALDKVRLAIDFHWETAPE